MNRITKVAVGLTSEPVTIDVTEVRVLGPGWLGKIQLIIKSLSQSQGAGGEGQDAFFSAGTLHL